MSESLISKGLPDQVRDEQIRLIYKQFPIILIGSSVLALAMAYLVWGLVDDSVIITWLALLLALAGFRGLLAWSYWNRKTRPGLQKLQWDRLFFIGAAMAGGLWGAATLLFYVPDEPEIILLIIVFYSGLITSCGASSGAYMPAFFYFAIPATVPLATRLLFDGREIFLLMGFLTIFFIGVVSIFVRTYHKNTLLLIEAQLENKLLLDQVREEKLSAESSQKIAEQAVVEKNRFLAAASHDLRQPLHALGLFIGALRRETDESQLHLIDSIQSSVGALNHMFNSLLDVSRLDAGVINVKPQHSHLDHLNQRLYHQYQDFAKERNLTLQIDKTNLVIFEDAILLERVLRNLLVNAINYTDKGNVEIRSSVVESKVIIQIIDSGIGIPENETRAIFSEYYQLNNPERDRNKGLGLGLAIVRRLCDLMNIPISVESVLEQGTTFTLNLPVGDETLVDREQSTTSAVGIEDLSVLIIDDERSVLQGMQTMLTHWGCQTLIAESAEEAVRSIGEIDFDPDIIFSDYRLRDNKTGVEAIDLICEELNRNVPAVVVTGDTSPQLLQEVIGRGFHLLHKPVTPDAINKALIDWVEKSNQG